ncbi:MAG: hypothetical protein KJ587_08885 [Alphaproteobacteria bacterium]|nr:hypothetical protein [Alphaproteobacteria bacterium]
MRPMNIISCAGLLAALALAGCGNTPGSDLVTSSLTTPENVAAQPAADPACLSLAHQIHVIRQEGTPAKVHAVADGKTAVVRLKRTSLAKVAELDRLNAEFQTKCSKVPMRQASAVPAASSAVTTASTTKTAASAAPAGTPLVEVPKR